MEFTITLDEIEVKALSYVMADPEEWTRNAISERARRAGDEIVAQETARLLADPNIDQIPASRDELIMNAPPPDVWNGGTVESSNEGPGR